MNRIELEQIRHPIQVAARRTGLTPEVIRAWERRYSAVCPVRSDTGRRLYSDEDIERLLLLRRATLAGRSIGQVARFSNDELRALVSRDEEAEFKVIQETGRGRDGDKETIVSLGPPPGEGGGSPYLTACMDALRKMDGLNLEETLARASVALGRQALLEQIVQPLLEEIGDCWRTGSLRVMHEHLASSVVRSFLGNLREGYEPPSDSAVSIVVTTPAGQIHELGALLVAATAASDGYRVNYLGPNLPAEEIVAAAQQSGATAVALSIIYPIDDTRLDGELRQIRRYLPEGVALLVGGRGADAYGDTLDAIGAVRMKDIASLRTFLEGASGAR